MENLLSHLIVAFLVLLAGAIGFLVFLSQFYKADE
jgi:hypothetical protein